MRALIMAFAAFSRIPVPQIEWDDRNMRYMMAFFPVIGLAIGVALAIWLAICTTIEVGSVLFGVGVAAIPIAITGGIHLDGLADVAAAQSSHAEPARKREILKDPHVGAFAIIAVALYLLVYAGVATELPMARRAIMLLASMHVASRCASSIATTMFAGNKREGMLAQFRGSADKRIVPIAIACEFAVAVIVACVANVLAGIAMAVVCVLMLAWIRWYANRQFGGMSGDLAGFFLQMNELAMLAAIVVVLKVVGL